MPQTVSIAVSDSLRRAAAASLAFRSGLLRRAVGRDYRAVAVGELAADELTQLVTSPERVLNDPTAQLVKRGRSALVVRVGISIAGAETHAAYKRCGSRTWLRRFLRGIRTSAALRNFRLARQLVDQGVDTPRPLLALSPRWRSLLRPSFLATEWIKGALTLDAFARTAAPWPVERRHAAFREAAERLGQLIGTLHKHGFSHRDLKSANLLVRLREGRIEVFLVDLDGAAPLRFFIRTRRLKNIARLHLATCRMSGVTRSLRCRFLSEYLATVGGSTDWKTVWRRLQKASRIPPAPASPAGTP
jgi:tRNA A-37 threonylcarbamoyl transferase component Bud32